MELEEQETYVCNPVSIFCVMVEECLLLMLYMYRPTV